MKNLLIIYSQWPPSNLAGVHRPRLIANFLKEFGWHPIILTVHEKYYEEKPDAAMTLTVNSDVEVIYCNAYQITRPRLIGDIGLRAFPHLYRKAVEIMATRKVDFIWIPIPSFYTALLGRMIFTKTNVPYGIDYIDPWVRDISTRKDWRHRLSNLAAGFLEPIAVKKASLITGVSYEYYKPVLERNFFNVAVISLNDFSNQQINNSPNQPLYHTAFPYGFDPNDHKIEMENIKYPWLEQENVRPWIYAGAFLPNSRFFVEEMFYAIAELRATGEWDEQVKLYFIGTGSYPGKTILEYSEDAGISDIVLEDRSRYPYLHVLNFLSASDTVMVIGSTEKHYTASKVYQALLSERPVWAIFHEESSAVQVMKECRADEYLVKYENGMGKDKVREAIKHSLDLKIKSGSWNPNLKALEKYSARESARKLVGAIEYVLKDPETSSG